MADTVKTSSLLPFSAGAADMGSGPSHWPWASFWLCGRCAGRPWRHLHRLDHTGDNTAVPGALDTGDTDVFRLEPVRSALRKALTGLQSANR